MPPLSPAFEKRLKRRVSGKTSEFFAVCPPGLTALCQRELARLPDRLDRLGLLPPGQTLSDIEVQPGGVAFKARLDLACLANLFLGTPTRLLLRLDRFKADHFSGFEKALAKVEWELFLPQGTLPRVRVTTRQSRLFHSDALAQRCEKILENALGCPAKNQNQEDQTGAGQTLMIRGENNWFDLSLDMAGSPLFKRGIKTRVVRAPLRETLAFAMLTQLKLSPADVLADPMAGSGTFSIEGAMMRAGLPPGLFRTFAFEAWPAFQAKRFTHAREKIRATVTPDPLPPIHASDIDPEAVAALAQTRAAHAFLNCLSIQCQDFFDSPAPAGPGVIVLNPPYGKRLGRDQDITAFFREIGKKLRQDYPGWRAGIICPNPGLLKALDLHLTPMPLFHGGLDLTAGLGRIP